MYPVRVSSIAKLAGNTAYFRTSGAFYIPLLTRSYFSFNSSSFFTTLRTVDNAVRSNDNFGEHNSSLNINLKPTNYLESDSNLNNLKTSFKSIVKIFCDSTDPNYSQPWQMRRQIKSTGSGFAIHNKLIITNAHCVSWNNRCLIAKHGSTNKYNCKIKAIGHECDLAVLEVEDNAFWDDIVPLKLGTIPQLHDSVVAIGYPTGGDNLCITSGVVSRVDVTTYAHSNFRLLGAQIDAAINPGNSGGPAMKDGLVVGVAFQSYDEAQNIGYIIPTNIINQFLLDLKLHERYTGFVTLGISYQLLENGSLRSFYGLNDLNESDLPQGVTASGILVCQSDTTQAKQNESGDYFKRHDIILAINGHDIADDGTIHFRDAERVHLAFSLNGKFYGDNCEVVLLRDKKVLTKNIKLVKPKYIVPEHQWDIKPRYYIYGGLVFLPLTMEYLKDEFGKKYYERAPTALLKPLTEIYAKKPDQEVVVLSQILASEYTMGYDFRNLVLKTVNDQEVLNLRHLAELLEGCNQEYVNFCFEQNLNIVLEVEKVKRSHQELLLQHAIPHYKSDTL